jgi:putative membrane-bound dehydrogenase-like protein
MNRYLLAFVLLPITAAWSGEPARPQDNANIVELNGHTFTLPPDFTIELVAGPPLVDRPIAADFDEGGRLYVTDSSGSNENVNVQLQKKPHRVVRLESSKGDGKFDKRTIFADKMMFPEGIMVHKGSVYVAAPPSIWKLTDKKGDGVADERVEWFQGKTLTGCANDLHGPYLGPDGWIYWCKGAFAKQTYEQPGKPALVTRAAHIFRARPDGSGVEPVMTGGMDNPVDVVFTPGGERIFTTTFLQYPGGGKRDGLIHAVYGGVYGKEFHDVIDDHIWTGPSVMPVLVHLGAAAPAGLHRYESDAFGKVYKDNLFACCFNMQKVTRHILEPDGATFKTRDSDFLVSTNKDFHPTDVIEDGDGSLLVIDTGGWYKLCCPTSQLQKPEVLGGIYRIRKKGMAKIDDPRGLKLQWRQLKHPQLVALFDDPRPVVRKRAVQALVDYLNDKSKNFALEFVGLSPLAALNMVWAATRMQDSDESGWIVRILLQNEDETVRHAAILSASLHRDKQSLPILLKLLKDQSAQNRRAAAEALGRIGDRAAVPALLDALADPNDRVLEHSLIYALIEIGDPAATAAGLKSSKAAVRRATLIALDQMPHSGLSAATVAAELSSTDARLKEAAWWIAGRHPDWGGTVAGFLQQRLNAGGQSAEEQEELVRQLARFGRGGPVQQLLGKQLRAGETGPAARRIILRAMALAGAKQAPGEWIPGLTQALRSEDVGLVQEAINTVRSWRDSKEKSKELAAALVDAAANPRASLTVRLTALGAVPVGTGKVNAATFDLLRRHLGSEQPLSVRSAAADALGRASLSSAQLQVLTASLQAIGPMELERVLDAYTGCTDDDVGMALLAGLRTASARASLRVDTLKPRLAKFGPAVREQANALYATLNADADKQRAHLENLLGALKDGDISRGRTVFNSQKAACFSCHAIGYLGGKLGPDLTRIARIRTERDLVESIVFPSASFVRGYEPVVATTKDGRIFNGIVRKDAADEIVLATGATSEVRIAREEIDELRPSMVSVMPAGFDLVLTRQELADLIAFLKTCK